jgi:ElaB/YqjD/DUF883 family membrane-anchored ribosome-binding protein
MVCGGIISAPHAIAGQPNESSDVMARKANSTVSDDIAEIEREIGQLMRDLEKRVGRLNSLTRSGVSHAADGARDYVSDTLSETAERLRDGAAQSAERIRAGVHDVGDETARIGQEALRRIEDEVGQRPLLTLAIAAGIGFLAGMAGRRH